MVNTTQFLVLDTVRGFEAFTKTLPEGRYFRTVCKYETKAGAVFQLARNLERIQGLARNTIVLVNRQKNPLSARDMEYVLASFENVQYYGEAA